MAKKIKMFMMSTCPYCKQAFCMMEELKQKYSAYQEIEMEVIDENKEPAKTDGYEYWYVPTFFVDDKKIHEGVPTMEKIQAVFEAAVVE
ncbi:MAG: thioredoxin family protein [Christensenellaceae bacterium]